MDLDAFVSTSKTFATDGSGVVKNGIVGYLYNVPVMVSDNNTYDTATSSVKPISLRKKPLDMYSRKTLELKRKEKLN